MERTDWTLIVSNKELTKEKSSRKKVYISRKIHTKDLARFVDDGWEKSKDYKSPNYVGVVKEKPVAEQFEDQVWLLFASMGFTSLNMPGFSIAYDFHDDSLKQSISVIAIDEETIMI